MSGEAGVNTRSRFGPTRRARAIFDGALQNSRALSNTILTRFRAAASRKSPRRHRNCLLTMPWFAARPGLNEFVMLAARAGHRSDNVPIIANSCRTTTACGKAPAGDGLSSTLDCNFCSQMTPNWKPITRLLCDRGFVCGDALANSVTDGERCRQECAQDDDSTRLRQTDSQIELPKHILRSV